MKLLSAKGEKSTRAERFIVLGVLLVTAVVIAPGIRETIKVNEVFSSAEPSVKATCKASSDYAPWRFWNSKTLDYTACIVKSKDSAVQRAAGKYLLNGKDVELMAVPQVRSGKHEEKLLALP